MLGTYYNLFSITSQDIETEDVITIDRPIKNLLRGYKYVQKDDYWIGKDVSSAILNREFNCKENQ
ncbi:MAG: hypothetical protein L3J23_08715 [Flavobacteriaceae bacterium]|nr:hypothetical protein [Flavobacteriaceae bacterium]